MSYKLPIIASDIPSNREVLEDEKAIWVKPENETDLVKAYHDCINKSKDWENITDYNYQKVINNYTWEKVATKYIGYWKSRGL